MSFFDKLKNAAEQIADSGTKQVEILKLQSQLGHTETELERIYAEAGKRARQMYRSKLLLDAEMDGIMKRIDEQEAHIDDLRRQVQDVQRGEAPASPAPAAAPSAPAAAPPATVSIPQVASQPAVGAPTDTQVYRPPVAAAPPGTEVEPGAPPPDELCPECGKLIPANARFCEHCGKKLVEG
jgi:hypothetical protein